MHSDVMLYFNASFNVWSAWHEKFATTQFKKIIVTATLSIFICGMSQYTDLARGILDRNDKGGYTVPTARLYPFQWNWDSAFVSMGFATFNVERAYREMERLVEGKLVRTIE